MDHRLSQRQLMLRAIVQNTINYFNQNETYLISRDVSERCICSKLASYLEKAINGTEYSEYSVDVEYNRGLEERDPKSLGGKKIVVDIIVHKRGRQYGSGNLICIEMKKGYKHPWLAPDKDRLSKLTSREYGYHYSAGFMILAEADKKNEQYGLRIESEFWG